MSARIAAGLVVLLASACWGTRDSYTCQTDSDCDLGVAGRCEIDGRCTRFDTSCDSQRRYTEHSGALSDTCFSDNAVPLNPCAAGQAPAVPTECFADVCEAEPACCATGWSEACVLEAQLRCPQLACETRFAITATKGTNTEIWQAAWSGGVWNRLPPLSGVENFLVWLAPAPGTATPRLAGIFNNRRTLGIDGAIIEIADRPYQWAASVDFERDGRDTVALSSGDATNPFLVELVELGTDTRHELPTPATQRLAFADYDHDPFPDAFAFSGNGYYVISSIGEDGNPRELAPTSSSSLPGGAPNNTTGTAGVHGLELVDLDRDRRLDLIASGTTVRVHLASPRIPDQPSFSIDCSPPASPPGTCDPALAAFTSTVVPTEMGANLYVGLYPQRTVYRGTLSGSPPTMEFVPIAVPCGAAPCPGFIGMFARDLDGDHHLDVVAIDADLALVTILAKDPTRPIYAKPFAPAITNFTAVKTSVTGFMP